MWNLELDDKDGEESEQRMQKAMDAVLAALVEVLITFVLPRDVFLFSFAVFSASHYWK